jgi:hypothetical protein
LLQSTAAKHHQKHNQLSSQQDVDDMFMNMLNKDHHKVQPLQSLSQQETAQANPPVSPAQPNSTAAAQVSKPIKGEEEEAYHALDQAALKKLQSLYDFSKRPETDNGRAKPHHEYDPWKSPLDFHGFNMRDAKEQMTDIKVVQNSRISKSGRHCLPFDFFTIHYKAFMQDGGDMIKVLDSRKINNGKPITF